jgi:hypothetical protein
MAARYVGQAAFVDSNKAPQGQIDGSQVGEVLPGILESLQEAPSAASTSTLYYEEALGQFLQPSFQANYGILNERVQNVETWGQSGLFTINNDIFWNGPAALRLKVDLRPRWWGPMVDGINSCRSTFMMPSYFYSHGAAYAAIKEFRMNMGGAGTYSLSRYSNFIGIMCSCNSIMQRYGLMKLAGGGVIASETNPLEAAYGLQFETATYGTVENIRAKGQLGTGLIPTGVRVPIRDNWVVAIKTPHTNFNNPRVRRRPLDTKLFSEHFTVDIWLANFDEICDSGTGVAAIGSSAIDNPVTDGDAGGRPTPFIYERNMSNRGVCVENHRQYENIYDYAGTATAANVALCRYVGTDYKELNYTLASANAEDFLPTQIQVADLVNFPNKELISSTSLPTIEMDTLISSLRLTNDMLGAYDVLKTRTDQAVYYPFQHFTTQIYSVQNTLYGDLTLDQYVKRNSGVSNTFLSDEDNLIPIRLPVSIPVNPMTAMYIAVAREKDRKGLGVSTKGGYSPCLFWNFLTLPKLQISYGTTRLIDYACNSDYISKQLYEHCSPLQIPYMGGFCLRSENAAYVHNQSAIGVGQPYSNPVKVGYSSIVSGKYGGVLRNSWVYEISLCEMEPLRNEAFFQQTPSFLGEELNISFTIEPSTLAFGQSTYSPVTDFSLIDSYYSSSTSENFTKSVENSALVSLAVDASGASGMTNLNANSINPGIPNEQKGGPVSTRKVDVWHMNNDANLMVIVTFAQNALWQLNPNMSKMVFARG